MYQNLPYPFELAYRLVNSFTLPVIDMTAQHSPELLKQAGTGVSAASFQRNIASFTFRPEMAADIIALVSSLNTPGHIMFNVDFSELPEESINLHLFIALLCKFLFFWSIVTPMNNITDESAREVERIILEGFMSLKLVEVIPGAPIHAYSLSRVQVPDARVRTSEQVDLEQLQTNFMGGGWANCTFPTNGVDPLFGVYPGCPPRPRFVLEFDDFDAYKDEEIFMYEGWHVARAAESVLNCFRQGNKGYTSLFHAYVTNLLRYFVRLNEYESENWYTGMRLGADQTPQIIGNQQNQNV